MLKKRKLMIDEGEEGKEEVKGKSEAKGEEGKEEAKGEESKLPQEESKLPQEVEAEAEGEGEEEKSEPSAHASLHGGELEANLIEIGEEYVKENPQFTMPELSDILKNALLSVGREKREREAQQRLQEEYAIRQEEIANAPKPVGKSISVKGKLGDPTPDVIPKPKTDKVYSVKDSA
jgi:hypothetical protein